MKYKAFILFVILNVVSIRTSAEAAQVNGKIKVGVYEYEPYIVVDDAGNISGYYYDYMRLLQENGHFEYEFVIVPLNEGIRKLVNGEIDIMLGASMNNQLSEELIFSRYNTNKEVFGVFSDESSSFKNLKYLKNLKLGMVEGDSNAGDILELFQANNIDVSIIFEKDYKTLYKLMEDDAIDLLVANKWMERYYYLVKEFIGRDVHIAGHKGSQAILESLDQSIEELTLEKDNPIERLHEKYFGGRGTLYKKVIISIVGIALLIFAIVLIPIINKKIIKNRIRIRMKKNQYILQYQPIYNPKNNMVAGFEGLLRLIDKKNKLIPPSKFIHEIEQNDMLFEVSLWLIDKAIYDYGKISGYTFMYKKDFYISVNLSLNEIENDVFVDRAIDLLKQSKLGSDRICLEIIERFKMEDLDKIRQNIKKLKQAGFKLAVDDFGVEYSNLDIFQKLNVDIIKVDKTFVDGIGKDSIKEEVVLFISRLAHLRNRSVVLEGVEEINQVAKIKEIQNDRLFVQGYYYSKPMYIEDIKRFSLV